MNQFVVLSGCSGGGKSTLLDELGARGFNCVAEPGRRIVVAEKSRGGTALPWVDAQAFLRLAVTMAQQDLAQASSNQGWTFFDRGLVDAASALAKLTGEPISETLGVERSYHQQVFLTPPWPEIYTTDSERQHQLPEAIQEYDRLLLDYPLLGYDAVVLPKISVQARADLVLQRLSL